MEEQLLPQNLSQPTLLEFKETSTGALELFPAVWSALEDLTAPEISVRSSAVDRLESLAALRLSPLAAYVTATHLTETDGNLRARIVQLVGSILAPDQDGRQAPDPVVRALAAYLIQMRVRVIHSLLETVEVYPELQGHVARMLNICPYAGRHLADILQDRKKSIPVRRQAAIFISLVGFLDAIPVIERLEVRLAARLSGQQAMPFAPPAVVDETELLPVVRQALLTLKSN